jgi:hypothetical protein
MDCLDENSEATDENAEWSSDAEGGTSNLDDVKAKLLDYSVNYEDDDIRSILLKYANLPSVPNIAEDRSEDHVRLETFLSLYLFLDATVEIEEVEIPEPDLESYLAEDTEDEERSDYRLYDGYISWECDNYHVEVRPDAKEIKKGRTLFRVRVSHKPHFQVQNSGHLYDLHNVEELCNLLREEQFEQAMSILFCKYGGGAMNGQTRSQEDLDAVINESWVRSTISSTEP